MISFEIIPTGSRQAIQISCDDAGLTALVAALESARTTGHLHLCSPSAGGNLLSDLSPFGGPAIGEVIVTIGGD